MTFEAFNKANEMYGKINALESARCSITHLLDAKNTAINLSVLFTSVNLHGLIDRTDISRMETLYLIIIDENIKKLKKQIDDL